MKNIAKRLGLSVIAASVLVSVASAGEVHSAAGGDVASKTVSKELIQVKGAKGVAYNLSDVYYVPHNIPAGSLSNPTFNYQISGVSSINVDNDANLSVFEVNGTGFDCDNSKVQSGEYSAKLVANGVEEVSTENGRALVFNSPDNSSQKVYNDKMYYICKASSTDADANVSGSYTVSFDVAKVDCDTQPSNQDLTVKLYSGDSQEKQDEASGEIVRVLQQYNICSCAQLDAQIDPSAAFTKFTSSSTTTGSGCSASQTTSDELCYTVGVKKDDVLNYNLDINTSSPTAAHLEFEVDSDKNLSDNISSITGGTYVGSITNYSSGQKVAFENKNDDNSSIVPAAGLLQHDYSINYVLNSDVKIPETKFTATVKLAGNDADNDNSCPLLEPTSAGEWINYGYEANIPEVTYVDGKIETVITVVNKSENDANVYFTVSNSNGDVCSIDTKADSDYISPVATGKFAKYNSADIVAACVAKNPNFDDASASYDVRIFVPTTPGEVFTYASFKNSAKNLFKDLPVYDNNKDYQH